MGWGTKQTLTGLNVALSEVTNVDADYVATSHFTEWVYLSPGETAHIQIQAVFAATGADMYYRIVGTLDDATENIDNVPFIAGSLGYILNTAQRRSFLVSGLYRFRVEVRKGGTTAGAYTPNVYLRKNGIFI